MEQNLDNIGFVQMQAQLLILPASGISGQLVLVQPIRRQQYPFDEGTVQETPELSVWITSYDRYLFEVALRIQTCRNGTVYLIIPQKS